MQTSHQKNLSRRHLQNKPQSSKSSSRHLTLRKWTGRLTSAYKFKTILLRKVSSLTIQETLKSHTPKARLLGLKPFHGGQLQWPNRCPTWLPAHPTHTQSHQVWPQVSHSRVSDVSFHKAIYSWHSNTETPGAGASKEGPRVEPLHFYTLTIYLRSGLAVPPQSSASAAEPSLSSYLAGLPSLHLLCCPKGWQFMAPAVSPCPFTWLAPPVQGWQFMASLQLTLSKAGSWTAACTLSYLHQRYSSKISW